MIFLISESLIEEVILGWTWKNDDTSTNFDIWQGRSGLRHMQKRDSLYKRVYYKKGHCFERPQITRKRMRSAGALASVIYSHAQVLVLASLVYPHTVSRTLCSANLVLSYLILLKDHGAVLYVTSLPY